MKDYYKILEVNKEASPEIIAKVYKILAKKYHPDLQKDSNKSECEEKFKEISEAYETLSDPDKRAIYDSSLDEYINQSKVDRTDYETLVDYCAELEKKLESVSNTTSNAQNNNSTYYSQPSQHPSHSSSSTNTNTSYKPHNNPTTNNYVRRNNVRYTSSFKETYKNAIAFLITLALVYIAFKIIWLIPSLKDYFLSLFSI